MNWLLTRLLKFMGGRLDGYKTVIGSLGKIITGVGTFIAGITMGIRLMFPDQTQFPESTAEVMLATFGTGVFLISTGIRDIGMAHKMDKQTDAINTQTTVLAGSIQANTVEVAYQGDKTVASVKDNTQAVKNPSGMSPETGG